MCGWTDNFPIPSAPPGRIKRWWGKTSPFPKPEIHQPTCHSRPKGGWKW